jgi:hypothetical protein
MPLDHRGRPITNEPEGTTHEDRAQWHEELIAAGWRKGKPGIWVTPDKCLSHGLYESWVAMKAEQQ